MKPGDTAFAFFLTAQGRIISDCYITCNEDHLLLDVEPEVRDAIVKHIDHYIIADDVTLEDVTDVTFGLLAAGKRLHGPVDEKNRTIAALGMTEATAADLEAYRIEQFHPLFGKDFTSSTLPQETGLAYALHFNKGCYLGQEIVERIRSRGHVNKTLVGLRGGGDVVFSAGGKVSFNGEEIGQVTSAANHSAIAMVRVIGAKPGAVVDVDGAGAEVRAVS